MIAGAELIVTVLGRGLSSKPPIEVEALWASLSAQVLRHEFMPAAAGASCACHRYWISTSESLQVVRTVAQQLKAVYDVAVLPASMHAFTPRLAAFDLDST